MNSRSSLASCPGIRVTDTAGKKVPGVAIKTTTIEGFASVSQTASST